MIALLTVLHVIVSVFLILVVLLQQGKGQDFASTFGGGGTQAAFGARSGTTILHRLTTVAAIMFMVTSMTLTILIARDTGSILPADPALPAVPDVVVPGEAPEAPVLPPATEGGGEAAPEEPAPGSNE